LYCSVLFGPMTGLPFPSDLPLIGPFTGNQTVGF